jgi:hypothetical protein
VSGPIWGSWPDIYYSLTVTVLICGGALSDERTGLSFIYAAGPRQVVFLGSESLRTRDHILLSQIWDFPFRRLLRLTGSRWRYSTPPPHGCWTVADLLMWSARVEPNISHHVLQFLCYSVSVYLFVATGTCLPNRCQAMDYSAAIRCSGNMCLASHWLTLEFRSGSTIPAFRRHITIHVYNLISFRDKYLELIDCL